LKSVIKYCSLVLAAIFIATLIPFHAFHKHMEEEHFVAINNGSENHSHHCKLDENYCQDLLIKHCEHKQHVAESAEKCFVSQYHFIKNITLSSSCFYFIEVFKTHYFEQKITNVQNQITILLNNKGPPASLVI
jgi:hypothetical protein